MPEEALSQVRKDIVFLLQHQPFYAYILTKMKKEIDERPPVASVAVLDGEVTLYINPTGYLSYPKKERIFILIHEIMHLMFYHHFRQAHRDAALWNIACDLAVNQLIESTYATMPSDALRIDSWQDTHALTLPPKESAEVYYDLLQQQKDPMPIPENMQQGPHGTHLQSARTEEGNADQPFASLHPTWEDSTDVSEQIAENMIQAMMKEAYTEANGAVPKAVETLLQPMFSTKISWKKQLHHFVAKQRTMTKKSTWKKRNRRLGDAAMGYKKQRKLVLAVAIDTSISITEEDFKRFYAEILAVANHGATIILMECDTAVHTITKFSPHHAPSFVGRRGTDFRPVFEAIKQKQGEFHRMTPDGLLFFTDGYGTAPDTPLLPTLWCLTKEGRTPYNRHHEPITWGSILYLDE